MTTFDLDVYFAEVNENAKSLANDTDRMIEIHVLTNYIAHATVNVLKLSRAGKEMVKVILETEGKISEVEEHIEEGKANDYPVFSMGQLYQIKERLMASKKRSEQTLSEVLRQGFNEECRLVELEQSRTKLLRKPK